jgi:hypothetical protein
MVNVIKRVYPGRPNNGLTVCQSMWCNYRVISLQADYVIDIRPEENWPTGREAAGIGLAWSMARAEGRPGLLLLGCDVAADLDDLDAMAEAAGQLPEDLHTGMVKLWPESTARKDWMWSHRGGTLGQPAATQDGSAPVSYVSLGFLWVPGRLLDLASPTIASWRHGEADVRLSELALTHGVPAHAVQACRPKHLHFQGEHDGSRIRNRAGQQDREHDREP